MGQEPPGVVPSPCFDTGSGCPSCGPFGGIDFIAPAPVGTPPEAFLYRQFVVPNQEEKDTFSPGVGTSTGAMACPKPNGEASNWRLRAAPAPSGSSCGSCLKVPLKSGGTLDLSWHGMNGRGLEGTGFAMESQWPPAGANGVFAFLPVSNYDASISKIGFWNPQGYASFPSTGTVPNSEFPITLNYGTTYFTLNEHQFGTYFEYWYQNSLVAYHPNRVYDTRGNQLFYEYGFWVYQGAQVLTKMWGDLLGNLTIYFGYDTNNNMVALPAIGRVVVADSQDPSNLRTTYYTYVGPSYAGGNPYGFVELVNTVNPLGCMTQYQWVNSSGEMSVQAEVDPEGFTTYYSYVPFSSLSVTVEPEGRVTYWNYGPVGVSGNTQRAFLHRITSTTLYQTSSLVDQMPMKTAFMDELGNTTYWTYNSTFSRVIQRLDPNNNLSYFEYIGGTGPIAYALTRKVSAFNGAQTYYGYNGQTYDALMVIGPRNIPGTFPVVTYHTYDASRNRTSMVDALGNTILFGPDSYGRLAQLLDARGYATYFIYDATTGFQTGMVDALGNVEYFAYNSYRDMTARISPRWPEAGFAAFCTYYTYDVLDRKTKTIDPFGSVTYFDYTPRSDLLDTVDALGTTTASTYSGLRLKTKTTVTDRGGNQLSQILDGFDIHKNRVQTQDALGNSSYFFYDTIDRLAAVMDPLSDVTYFGYDSVSNRTRLLDARGNTTYFEFDLLSRQTALQDALGNRTLSFYDLADNRTQIVDARSNPSYFFYDALDRLNVTRDALANATYFYFDEVSNYSILKNARFNSTYYFYDGLSRRISMRDAQGNITYYAYDAKGNLTQLTDARSNVAQLFYDPLDRTTITLDPLLNATYFGYDFVSNRTRVMDARFNTIYFFYDGLHRRTVWVDAQLNITYFGYDQTSNLTSIEDPRLNATYFFWDAVHRRSAIRDAIGNVTYFGYNPIGDLTQVMDARANSTYFTYDADNRRTAAIDALTNTTKFFYDAVSNRTVVLDPLLNATYFGYDAINRLTTVQDALGGVTYFEFDPVSHLTKILDPDKHATQTQYDTLDRPSAVRYSDAGSVYFFYDAVSNRSKVVDSRGNPTYYAYDAVNRLSALQDALGRTLYFQYDAVGNLSISVDAEGGSASYAYDKVNRRTNIAYAVAGADSPASLGANPYYVYDPASNLVQMGDLWGLHLWSYDADNRPIQHQYPNRSVVYFRYDQVWNVAARSYPGTSGTVGAAYDAVNRQTKVQSPSGETAYFTYDAASNLTKRLLGNGAKLVANYDAAERISKWRYGAANGASLSYFDYTRDAKGLITKAFREATNTVYYSYDSCDRLLSETWLASAKHGQVEVYGYRYAYDIAGNRLKALINGSATYYFYDQANQLKVTGTTSAYASPTYYIYDKNGSVTNIVPNVGATTYFAYNAAGLVAQIKWADASSSYFYYDGQLRRYAAVISGTATYFLWEGPDLLQELNADGTTKEEHTNAQVPIPGIGQLVETNRPGQTQQKIFPVMDPRGSITKYIQSDGSTVFASREYDAFGTMIPNSATGTWPGRFGYQGESWQEIFSANGSQRILISPARLYDPTTGRFLQNEPVLLRRPKAQYLFCSQNPVRTVDPQGRQDLSPPQRWSDQSTPAYKRPNPWDPNSAAEARKEDMRGDVRRAIDNARSMVTDSLKLLSLAEQYNPESEQVQYAQDMVTKWFGDSSPETIYAVKYRYQTILNKLNEPDFFYKIDPFNTPDPKTGNRPCNTPKSRDSDEYAVTLADAIHINSNWYLLDPTEGPNSRAGNIIHETLHWIYQDAPSPGSAEFNVEGAKRDPNAVMNLAQTNQVKALTNPDNYKFFSENPTKPYIPK